MLVAHAGKILLKVIARRFSEYCERMGILTEEQSGFRPNRSTTDMTFVARRLQEGARKNTFRCMYVLSTLQLKLTTPLTLHWTLLAHFGVPKNMTSDIRQFHEGMRACMRLDEEVCSRWLVVEHEVRQGCVLAPLLFNIFFAVIMNVAYTPFKVDEDIMDALVHLRKKIGAWGRRGGGEQSPESQPWRRS